MERCVTCQYVEGLWKSHWGSVSLRKFLPVFLFASFYQKIQQTIKIKEIPRKSLNFLNLHGMLDLLAGIGHLNIREYL